MFDKIKKLFDRYKLIVGLIIVVAAGATCVKLYADLPKKVEGNSTKIVETKTDLASLVTAVKQYAVVQEARDDQQDIIREADNKVEKERIVAREKREDLLIKLIETMVK